MEKRPSAPTIVDVAARAGVHPATVSRVFSGKASVSPATAQAVRQAAEDLGFKLNRAARHLVTGRTLSQAVGIALPLMTHPFYAEIIKGIHQTFESTPYNLLLFNLGRQEAQVFDKILSEDLAGLLTISHQWTEAQTLELKHRGLAAVSVDTQAAGHPWVFLDQRQGGLLAAEYLFRRGCRQPFYLGEEAQTPQQTLRRAGFRDYFEARGIRPLERSIPMGQASAQEAAGEILKTPADGIFCYCDEMAYGVLEVLRREKKELPLVGFDDLLPSRYLGLTTINQQAPQAGALGAQILLDLMEGRPTPPSQLLEPSLVVRQT